MYLILIYFLLIVIANVLTARFAPMDLGLFLVPYGTLFIAASFFVRDFIQQKFGRKKTYHVIFLALSFSAITSYLLKDPLWIVFASVITFAISETTDTEIFTRLKTNFANRVLISGLIGTFLDSTIFVIIGLSPIGAGFLQWEFVFMAIMGQIFVKYIVQLSAYFVIKNIGKQEKGE
jgi:uncharacterized PurR-regulated membrane protein YhhQ (DUF165 family)